MDENDLNLTLENKKKINELAEKRNKYLDFEY